MENNVMKQIMESAKFTKIDTLVLYFNLSLLGGIFLCPLLFNDTTGPFWGLILLLIILYFILVYLFCLRHYFFKTLKYTLLTIIISSLIVLIGYYINIYVNPFLNNLYVIIEDNFKDYILEFAIISLIMGGLNFFLTTFFSYLVNILFLLTYYVYIINLIMQEGVLKEYDFIGDFYTAMFALWGIYISCKTFGYMINRVLK